MDINLNKQWTVLYIGHKKISLILNFKIEKNEISSTLCSIPNQFVRILHETQNMPDPYIDTNYETYLE